MNFGIKQIRKFPGRSVYNVNIFGCSEYLDALRRLIRMRVPQPMVARRPWSATVSCQGSGRLIACCCQGSAALCLPKDFSSKLHACYNRTQKTKLNKMLKKLCKVASPITINTCFKSSPIWIQIRCFVFAILWNGVSTLEKQNRFYDKVISKKKVIALAKTENRVMLVVSSVCPRWHASLVGKKKEPNFRSQVFDVGLQQHLVWALSEYAHLIKCFPRSVCCSTVIILSAW